MVQPIWGKVLLPLLGGSPAVWNTCMVFFQAVLLLGYGYAHVLSTRVPLKWQPVVHVGLLIVAGVTLPRSIDVGEPGGSDPAWWVVKTLCITVGLPFLVVSTTGPLLQRWFSRTDHPQAKDPYFLYAASNAGSVLGLLAYPLVMEPRLTRGEQNLTWSVLFWVLAPMIGACGAMVLRANRATGGETSAAPAPAPSWATRGMWVLLAFIPSSLMIGVTQSISTDVAAVPLMWIVPLLLYLVSFILAFSGRWGWNSRVWGRLLPFGVIALTVVILTGSRSPLGLVLFIHVITFFLAAMLCHRRLAESRPDPSRLTEFYFALSLGGVLGGIFNALVAPQIFGEILEYPLVIGLACMMRPGTWAADKPRPHWWGWGSAAGLALLGFVVFWYQLNILNGLVSGGFSRTPAFAHMVDALKWLGAREAIRPRLAASIFTALPVSLVLVAGLAFKARRAFGVVVATALVSTVYFGQGGLLIDRTRTFFGVIRVTNLADPETGLPSDRWHMLGHGTTIHGRQAQTQKLHQGQYHPDPETRERLFWGVGAKALPEKQEEIWLSALPTSYYHPRGPIGEIVRVLQREDRLKHAALIGMGAGSMAAYARAGDTYDFFEIDPAVVEIASNPAYFSYLYDANKAGAKIVAFVGDGRLGMRDRPDDTYDLIVVDAFSSDAIPVHLITREAVQIYMSKLKPGGVLAFHLSNRYFDLPPVVARIAQSLSLQCWLLNDNTSTKRQEEEGKAETTWVAVVRDDAALGPISRYPTRWLRMAGAETDPLWTDDYASVFRALVGMGVGSPEVVKRATQPVGVPKKEADGSPPAPDARDQSSPGTNPK